MNIEKWLKSNTKSLFEKTVLISGATGGIGKELCRYLAELNANLILLNRNIQKSLELKSELETVNSNINIELLTADFEDFSSVKAATDYLLEQKIDIVIHNAGAYSIPRKITSVGYDNVFQTNFLVPYYITKQLLPNLKRQKDSRVVVVGSIAHNYCKTKDDDIDFRNTKQSNLVYGNSKRYLMFSLYELFKNETDVSISICHPGITFTNITAHYPKLIFAIIKNPMKLIFMNPKIAALSVLLGCFKPCEYNEWIGPGISNIWGLPKKQKLKTVGETESQIIYKNAEQIYNDIKKRL